MIGRALTRTAVGVASLAVVVSAGCNGRNGGESVDVAEAAIPVEIAKAQARTVDRTMDVVGTLFPEREATVAALVPGPVIDVRVQLGDRVEKGDTLVKLATKLLEASLREADARLRSAVAEEDRARSLLERKVVSPQEYENRRTSLEVARANREAIAVQIEQSEVRAPFSGAVTERFVDVGDYVGVGGRIATLVADRVLRLRGEVPERFIADLREGLELRGEVEAYPGLTIRGRLTRLNAALDPGTRSLTFEAMIDNEEGQLRAGFFVRASIVVQKAAQAVSVPLEAVVSMAGRSYLYVLSNGTAKQRTIETGQRFGEELEVLYGVAAGEPVIVTGLGRLHDGVAVRPADAEEIP